MRHRPRASAWVVVIGCLVLALVTLYSRQLLNRLLPPDDEKQATSIQISDTYL
jgi:hypothetical protein